MSQSSPKLLTTHDARFLREGMFFEALLGVSTLGRALRRFLALPEPGHPPPLAEPPAQVLPVHYCLLGALHLQRVLSDHVRGLAAAEPAERPRSSPRPRNLLR